MRVLKPFEPDGEAGDKFFLKYWEGLEEEIDQGLLDPTQDLVPVNPAPDIVINSFVVRHSSGLTRPPGISMPNLVLTGGDEIYALWFFPVVRPEEISEKSGKPSGHNAFLMVRHMYEVVLEGVLLDQLPSPYFYPEAAQWRPPSSADSLASMRKELQAAGRWAPMPPEFMSRGGSSTSEAKKRAARDNAVIARRKRSDLAMARYERIREAHASGLSLDEIAGELDLSREAARKLLERSQRANVQG
ncbi:hypothetical protein ABLE68_13680 [Nocardioides sp. CN2-186]|uniref:hypothetical protein n=1 Tax=Nocardioides tweenelious TaxID=3156607 RepID=UPI0032B4BF63